MAMSQAHSLKLKDRTLFFDGDSVVDADHIMRMVSEGVSTEGLFVEEPNDEIKQYNKYAKGSERITTKTELSPLTNEWMLPEEYKKIDVTEYIKAKFKTEMCDRKWEHTPEVAKRSKRIQLELDLYNSLNLNEVLRVLIYVINTLHNNKVVWGVGRGSSVSSYILYLIGVHDIDSVEYDLDIADFLR